MSLKQLTNPQDFGMLTEAGFVAVKLGNQPWAQALFHAASSINPDHTGPVLGFGYAALHSMDLKLADKVFRDVLDREPENALAKVLLGFTLLVGKFISMNKTAAAKQDPQAIAKATDDGVKLINEAMSSSQDPTVKSLGQASLALLEKVNAYQKTPVR